jgi:hypothetical protein
MYKSRAWQIWWENDPDARRFVKLSESMCIHTVNIPELTREAFLAGIEYSLQKQKVSSKEDFQNK